MFNNAVSNRAICVSYRACPIEPCHVQSLHVQTGYAYLEVLINFLASTIEIFLVETKDKTILCLITFSHSCDVAR